MPVLIIMRGLPGSGKTTTAKRWVSQDLANRARVNRDDIREMLHDGVYKDSVTEKQVVAARNAVISALLTEGVDVISDDTNLPALTVKDLCDIAESCGARIKFQDLRATPLETCLERNAKRKDKDPIPEDVIRNMHEQHIRKYV